MLRPSHGFTSAVIMMTTHGHGRRRGHHISAAAPGAIRPPLSFQATVITSARHRRAIVPVRTSSGC
jgi:hypothetical protein